MSDEPGALLRVVVDRIIPADEDPGALALGTDRYVMAQLGGEAVVWAEDIAAGLAGLEALARLDFGQPFEELAEADKDRLIEVVEQQPWFGALAELAAEGFYADPGNGGNLEARSWAMIGYEHRLPDGPSGPSAAAALSSAISRRPA
jgi:Gluconate 2-dehydrogenase subunit 3